MLKSLELENFKAFGERVKIPFAPITLIFGENSSGKSSILQSLNLLKQTRESREIGSLLLPRTNNGISDLGSFQDLLFDHDLSRAFIIKIALDLDSFDTVETHGVRKMFLGHGLFSDTYVNSVAMEFKFYRPSLEKEVFLDEFKIFLNSNNFLARFNSITVGQAPREILVKFPNLWTFWDENEISNNINYLLPVVKCSRISNDPIIWASRFEFCKARKVEILEFLQRLLPKQANNGSDLGDPDDNHFDQVSPTFRASTAKVETLLKVGESYDEKETFDKERRLKTLIEKAINFYSSEFSIEDFISRIKNSYLGQCIEIEGFLPTSCIEDGYEESLEELYIRSLSRLETDSQKIFTIDFRQVAILAGKILEEMLHRLFPLGPYRNPPERWYIFTGTSPKEVGYKGDQLPALLFRKPKLVKEVNNWLKKLDIGYQIRIESLGEKLKDLFEVKLVDTRRSKPVEVGLPDVGFGISQLLPFIVQSLSSTNKIISIEQPEVHIHPRLQADLGDLLAETIKSPWRNQFIIETHSEHLVLRLQKLVSEKKLSPSDISILYVSRGANGSKVQQLQLDEEGDFIDDWPGGFFPERLRELR